MFLSVDETFTAELTDVESLGPVSGFPPRLLRGATSATVTVPEEAASSEVCFGPFVHALRCVASSCRFPALIIEKKSAAQKRVTQPESSCIFLMTSYQTSLASVAQVGFASLALEILSIELGTCEAEVTRTGLFGDIRVEWRAGYPSEQAPPGFRPGSISPSSGETCIFF